MKVYQIVEKKSSRGYYGWETSEKILPEVYAHKPTTPDPYYRRSDTSCCDVEYYIVERDLIGAKEMVSHNKWHKYPKNKPKKDGEY